MTTVVAVLLLVIAFPFVVWPLVQGRIDRARHAADAVDRRPELREEVELDVATGRLSREEAASRLEAIDRA